MEVFLVGGAVRDQLLGRPVVERDWVVVGATPEIMLAEGYQQIQGGFPVFLHAQTNEEYALARREVKNAPGYRGFEVDYGADVTLEEDLKRRDLTINAIAEDGEGNLLDPYGGQADLEKRLLHHVSEAFTEDPVRLLRVARFAAQLGEYDFEVASATRSLLQQIVSSGELSHLRSERLWKETQLALGSQHPQKFFEILTSCGALQQLFPSLAEAMQTSSAPMAALLQATLINLDTASCWAVLMASFIVDKKLATESIIRHRADKRAGELLLQLVAAKASYQYLDQLNAEMLLGFCEHFVPDFKLDNSKVVSGCACLFPEQADANHRRLQLCCAAALKIQARTLLEEGFSGEALGKEMRVRRIAAIQSALKVN